MIGKLKIKYKAKLKCKIKEIPEPGLLYHPSQVKIYSATKVTHASSYPVPLMAASRLSASFR